MKKKNNGFTLIELLAVIVILAIIALIAVPIVLNIIERARKGAFTRSAENVLKTSNLYYTNSLLDIKQPEDIRFECTNNECLSSKLDENGNPKSLNVDGNIGEGYVLITNKGEVEFLLQNGSYCAVKYQATKNIIVKNETCSNIDINNDETTPIIDKINTVVKTNSITVTVSAYDNESGISGYQFSIDNGNTWTEYQTNNVHTFNNLTNDKVYKIRVRVYNGTYGKENFEESKGMSEQETEEISLKQIEEPTFEITPEGWSTSKTVTITYPAGYTNEYSIDDGNTFVPYTGEITVTANGNIIAKITDGNNVVTKVQMIEKIDNTVPEITTGEIESTYKDITIPFTATDDNSIKGIICKYGEDTLDKNGTIKNNICVLDNIEYPKTYKYEIKVVDNASNEKSVSGTAKQELSYVTDGLIVYYDGYTEPENGKWKDLSGNGNDGTINGAVWDTNHFVFDGIDDYIVIGKIHYPNTTFEAIVAYNSTGVSQHVVADVESAGRTLYIRYSGRLVFQAYVNNVGYVNADASAFMSEGRISHISSTISENIEKVFYNGNLSGSNNLSSYIVESTAPISIGCNPVNYERCNTDSFYKGNIYGVRIYNRALTEDEIKTNYTIDKARFNIE